MKCGSYTNRFAVGVGKFHKKFGCKNLHKLRKMFKTFVMPNLASSSEEIKSKIDQAGSKNHEISHMPLVIHGEGIPKTQNLSKIMQKFLIKAADKNPS